MTRSQYEAKVYLDKVRDFAKEVEKEKLRVEEYETYVLNVKAMAFKEKVDTGKYKKNVFEEKMVKLLDKKKHLEETCKKFKEIKSEMGVLISSIKTKNIRDVLKLRYIDCLSWETVKEHTGFQRAYVAVLNTRGLDAIYNLLN